MKYANEERDKLNLIQPLIIYEGIVEAFHNNIYNDIELEAQARLGKNLKILITIGLGTAVLFANDLSELHMIGGCLIKSSEELFL